MRLLVGDLNPNQSAATTTRTMTKISGKITWYTLTHTKGGTRNRLAESGLDVKHA